MTVTHSADDTDSRTLALRTRDLSFCWHKRQLPLHFPDLELARGEHLFLEGASGSGKSTLLALLCGLQRPESGHIFLLGQDLGNLRRGELDRFRADHLGIIFQQFNLVPYLSALGNVLLPCRLSRRRRDQASPDPEQAARDLLQRLDIPEDHWQRPVTGLSIGQQQRVAAARALIGMPPLILADEPTSALDTRNRDRFLDLLLELARENHSAVVFVSHDPALARHFRHRTCLGNSCHES